MMQDFRRPEQLILVAATRRVLRCSFIAVLLLTSVVSVGVSSAGATQPNSDYPAWSSLPTLAQLQSELAHASAKTTITSHEISGLQVGNPFPDTVENKGQKHCQSEDEVAYSFAPCVYGDTSSKRVIALVGDSEADMWIPTFDVWGKEYGFKVDRIEMDGCTAWKEKAPASISGWSNCEVKWKAYCVSEILKLHPFAVVATGMLIDSQSAALVQSPKKTATGIDKYFSAISKSKAKLFVLSNIPWAYSIPTIPSVCVDIHTSDIRVCDAKIDPTMAAALKDVQRKGIAKVIPIDSLFCSTSLCPVVDREIVLYSDNHHMSHSWATYIARAFSEKFNPMLGIK